MNQIIKNLDWLIANCWRQIQNGNPSGPEREKLLAEIGEYEREKKEVEET